MARMYSEKATSRWWPVHVFYNTIDVALINNWIIYKETVKATSAEENYKMCPKSNEAGVIKTLLKNIEIYQSQILSK